MIINKTQLDSLWNQILNRIELEIDDKMTFDTFFSNSKIVNIEDNIFTILVSKFGKAVITANPNYISLINDTINSTTETNYVLKIVDTYENNSNNPVESSFIPIVSNLSLNYTFNNFVVGPSNHEAHSAALAVALSPGKFYSPLFIFGKSGLGKTHLLHSIGNYIRQKNNNLQILFCSANDFVSEYFRLVKQDGLEALKEKFQKIDVLLLDDVQYLIGKKSVNELFFLIFNFFVNNNKQIVITSDRPALELKDLEE
ncbi:MAG: ATP-binding protein [Bacillales bacterium]|jgi:chromosomal replication initiator protein|nr:ATP-binding protein [Bacillales bacterium]